MDEFRGLWRGKHKVYHNYETGEDVFEWADGYLIRPEFNPSTAYIGYLFATDNHDLDVVQVDPSTLGACVGFPDKNGKPIFEGDFVKHYCYKDEPTRFEVGVIFWENNHARFKRTGNSGATYFIFDDGVYSYEVIGNIYDNPELCNAAYNFIEEAAKPTT